MWTKPYGMKEGFLIGGGLIFAGLMLELSVGPVDWDAFRWPVNGIVLAGFLALIAIIFLLRKSQWRWDYSIASHGATFHAPQEVIRLLAASIDYAKEARILIARTAAKYGHTGEIPVPDYSTKAKAQQAIGLDMQKLNEKKQKFLDQIVPKWIDEAKKNGKVVI